MTTHCWVLLYRGDIIGRFTTREAAERAKHERALPLARVTPCTEATHDA